MYQTLNTVPPQPNTLNTTVPEMVNFIVAKALAKGVEDRYQNAKDFAVDLRTCRDTLPRSGQQVDLSKPQVEVEKRLPDAIDITERMGTGEEDAKTASSARLSKAFDSVAATMRLAALTATSEDVDELSKTFNMGRPSSESINQAGRAALSAGAASPAQARNIGNQGMAEPSTRSRGGNWLVVVIVLLMLLLIMMFFTFKSIS
jgi:serine/threonine-protein kinase